MWQTYVKQDNKVVSIKPLWLRSQFYFQYHMILKFLLLIYNSNFIVCNNKARISFQYYVKEKRKCSFENAVVEKSKRPTNLK